MKRLPLTLAWLFGALLVAAFLFNLLRTRYAGGNEFRLLAPILIAAPFLLMRRRPVIATGSLLSGMVVVTLLIAQPRMAIDVRYAQILAADVAVAIVAATQRSRVTSYVVAATLLLQVVLNSVFPLSGEELMTNALLALAIVTAAMSGNSIRQRRLRTEAQRAQAEADAVVAERLRIAREVHDMVAHSIAVIAIQAGVGRRVIQTQPEEASRALDTIETTSRQTLAGLRRTLSALRQGSAPLEPLPGLDDLDQLVASAAAGGVTLDIQRIGTPMALPEELGLSAYRIVQEAVSNVVRHASAQRCRVTVEYRDGEVAIEVVDDGRGCADPTAGYGILGMRERAELLAGSFAAGPRPEGGFRIAATLPVPAAAGAA